VDLHYLVVIGGFSGFDPSQWCWFLVFMGGVFVFVTVVLVDALLLLCYRLCIVACGCFGAVVLPVVCCCSSVLFCFDGGRCFRRFGYLFSYCFVLLLLLLNID